MGSQSQVRWIGTCIIDEYFTHQRTNRTWVLIGHHIFCARCTRSRTSEIINDLDDLRSLRSLTFLLPYVRITDMINILRYWKKEKKMMMMLSLQPYGLLIIGGIRLGDRRNNRQRHAYCTVLCSALLGWNSCPASLLPVHTFFDR